MLLSDSVLTKKSNLLTKSCGVLACILLVSACSSNDTSRQANRDFDYLKATEKAPLVIAEGLDTPEYTKQYSIPTIAKDKHDYLMGSDIDIRSPIQILALSSFVRVDRNDQNIAIWFNSKSFQDDISALVWTSLSSFLADKNVTIAKLDEKKRVLETDWLLNDAVFAEYKEQGEFQLKHRFRFTLLKAKSKRTIGLKVELIDNEKYLDGKLDPSALTAKDKRRYAIQMLNLFSIYDEAQRLEAKEKEQKAAQAIKASLKSDEDEYPLILLSVSFDKAWEEMPKALEKLGFSVEDEDKIAGNLSVSYDAPSDDYWVEQKITPVTLEEDDYVIQLGEVKGKSSLSFYDEDKKPLSAEAVNQLFISLQEAFALVNAEK